MRAGDESIKTQGEKSADDWSIPVALLEFEI